MSTHASAKSTRALSARRGDDHPRPAPVRRGYSTRHGCPRLDETCPQFAVAVLLAALVGCSEDVVTTAAPAPTATIVPTTADALGGRPKPVTAVSVPTQLYIVQPGDTLFDIAARFGVTVDEIVQTSKLRDPGEPSCRPTAFAALPAADDNGARRHDDEPGGSDNDGGGRDHADIGRAGPHHRGDGASHGFHRASHGFHRASHGFHCASHASTAPAPASTSPTSVAPATAAAANSAPSTVTSAG